jgi:hypothetical protein
MFQFVIFLTILTIPFSPDCLMEIKHQLILERCFNSTFVFVFTKYNICGKHVEGKIGWKIVMCDRTLIQILLVYHLPTNPPKTVTTYTHKINCSFNKKYIGFCITRWKTKTKLCPINPVVSITNTFFLILRWKIKNKLCPINSQINFVELINSKPTII